MLVWKGDEERQTLAGCEIRRGVRGGRRSDLSRSPVSATILVTAASFSRVLAMFGLGSVEGAGAIMHGCGSHRGYLVGGGVGRR